MSRRDGRRLVVDVITDLPAPPGWTAAALCAQVDPDLWFPEPGAISRPAKRVCRECFVAAEGLEYALERRIWFGVWGGVDEHDRRVLADDTWNDATTTRSTPLLARCSRPRMSAAMVGRSSSQNRALVHFEQEVLVV